jgi:YidC/Oxa1 family membrane protein insertase
MGQLFDRLQQVLGTVLSFFYDLLIPVFSNGWSYGLAIILLTISINIVVFPLTLKQTRATRAFTEIQPKIKKIQAEYKDDPQEMQRRLMAAQKEAGATPGGCLLPLLVQMPIWFALFRLLGTPIRYLMESGGLMKLDAAGAPIIDTAAIQPIDPVSGLGMALNGLGKFFESGNASPSNWVPGFDMHSFLGMNLGISPSKAMTAGLTVAIPYLLVIAFMVATQYVQQWHSTYGQKRPSGQPGAGAQQAITKIMPLFIGFISWNFPAGLVLYWTTSNLFRLGQQVLIFKIDGRPPTPGSATKEESPAKPDSDEGTPTKPQQGAADKRRRRRRR